ncbi:SDR family NAD(P)-dependent oxidoreductase [Streptomyces sp. NPDC059743]|uniref:SDR family NAD(P)-dependent oxidoreductase n=1 Tax=Streptomyces sp. NPDC059743 TaxID=3346928 RepID=UPI00365C4179
MAQDSLITSSQKVAIVTGASGGIGAAVVEACRGLGYGVTATGRSIPSSDDRKVLALAGDVTAPGTAARLVEATTRRFGRVDTLVNCAGIFVSKPFTEYTDEDLASVVGVNVRGFFDVSRSAIGAMLARDGWGMW